jgi:hypothetical protein
MTWDLSAGRCKWERFPQAHGIAGPPVAAVDHRDAVARRPARSASCRKIVSHAARRASCASSGSRDAETFRQCPSQAPTLEEFPRAHLRGSRGRKTWRITTENTAHKAHRPAVVRRLWPLPGRHMEATGKTQTSWNVWAGATVTGALVMPVQPVRKRGRQASASSKR